ncbi:SbcC/MukB-like Walker B domain-containing protein [Azospirillum brasilense]|uniref:SbcC/MukB-like Walker B domain-containing protein n=1 Tax=Azospirillum brasilense TaxID=192 RepID=UPI001EDBC7FD|nr:SbcC/MukB-like Walker B domain-containing protein [Azospirillum brasilense]UKJ75392.1 AAA family ATPase [Azospirillum brasilense]
MRFVNWYAFFKEDIRIDGRTAILGHNGAGKSAILDALQTVLTGDDRSRLRLNASVQNDEIARVTKSRRSVRDYCLGAIDDVETDSDAEGATFLREQAITYLLMGFRRTDAGREVTLGVCLEAHREMARETVAALFIVEGRILTTDDVADTGTAPDGTRWSEALPWDEARARIAADDALTLHTPTGPELFVSEICLIAGTEFGRMDKNKFLKNLRNAVTFKSVTSATEFVRNFILDSQPVSVADMRASIARYAEIEKKIAELKDRLTQVEALGSRVGNVRSQRSTLARRRLASLQGHLHLACAKLGQLMARKGAIENAVAEKTAALGRLEEQKTADADHLRTLEAAHAANSDTLALNSVAVKIREIDVRLGEWRSQESVVAAGRLVARFALAAPFAEAVAPEAMNRIDPTLRTQIATGGKLPAEDKVRLSAALLASAAPAALRSALDAVDVKIGAAQARITELNKQLELNRENAERVRAGKRLLSDRTLALMRALRADGIEATPLCERVTDLDEEWRAAAEAALGDRREALLVEPGAYEQALKTYRRQQGLDGAMVVNTTKTAETRPAKAGSLATAIAAEDRHARAFLDYALGGILMVDTEADLRREDAAITRDLMSAGGRTVRKLRAPVPFLLGKIDTQGMLDSVEESRRSAETHLAEQETELTRLRCAERALRDAVAELERLTAPGLAASLADFGRIAQDRADAETRRQQLESAQDRSLIEAIRAAKADLHATEEAIREATADKGRIEGALQGVRDSIGASERSIADLRDKVAGALAYADRVMEASQAEERRAVLTADGDPGRPEFDRVLMEEFTIVENPADDPRWLPAALAHLDDYVLLRSDKRLAATEDAFLEAVREYLRRSDLPRPACVPAGPLADDAAADASDDDRMAEIDAVAAWVAAEDANLRDNELVRKEAEAARARLEAIQTFKEDFVGKMRGAFDAMGGLLEELNRQLRKRSFHGLTYRFARQEAPGYRDMIALIERSSDPTFDMPLFNTAPKDADGLDEESARALKRLQEIATDPDAGIGDIEDPRRYFEFRLEMLNSKGVVKTDLARRIGTASGGQLQVPFYVAIGAALAATAYPDRKGLDGGISLALFDEAFNKMDAAVIDEVLAFNRSIGLQTVIAAPDKERTTFEQLMETIVTISRIGTSVMIDTQHVKELARERFRSENPRLLGFAAFKEHAAGASGGVG